MKKRSIIMVTLIGLFILVVYLQCGRDVKVSTSYVSGSETGCSESITVIANKLHIFDQEKLARQLIQRFIDNSFRDIRFSYDMNGYPSELCISVYLNNRAWKSREKEFEVLYQHESPNLFQYNMKENPEKFQMEILQKTER